MKLLRKDPVAALERERERLRAAEARALELERVRKGKLLEAEGFDEIWALDRAIAEQRAAAAAHAERIELLREQVRRQEHDRRLRERAEFIAAKAKQIAARDAVAADLEAALQRVAELYEQFTDARTAILGGWRSDLLPAPGSFELRGEFVHAKIVKAFDVRNRGDAVVSNVGRRTAGLAAQVAEGGAAFVNRLRTAPLPINDEDDEAAA